MRKYKLIAMGQSGEITKKSEIDVIVAVHGCFQKIKGRAEFEQKIEIIQFLRYLLTSFKLKSFRYLVAIINKVES